jgi:hypothetical protein
MGGKHLKGEFKVEEGLVSLDQDEGFRRLSQAGTEGLGLLEDSGVSPGLPPDDLASSSGQLEAALEEPTAQRIGDGPREGENTLKG